MRIRPITQTVSPTTAPRVRAPLNLTSGFAEGLGQVGQAMGQVGQTINEIALRKKYFDDSVSLTNLTNDTKLALDTHGTLITEMPYDEIDDAGKKGIERIGQESADKASEINPEVAANWKKIWSTLSTDQQIKDGRIKTEKFRQSVIAGTVSFLNVMEDEAVTAALEGDTEKLNMIYASADSAVNNVRDNFRVPGHTAEMWKEGLRKGVEAKVKAAQAEMKKQQDKQVITDAYLGISQEAKDPLTGKTDYPKAYELLRQPGTLEKYGITAEQKKTLTGIFTNEQARDKEITDKAMEQERSVLLPMVSDGTATIEQIRESNLPEKEKLALEDKLRARNKAILKGEENPFNLTDPAVDNEILQRVYSIDPPSVEEIRALTGKGLSTKRAEHWINVLKKPDAGYKRALDYLRSQITPKKGLLVGESTEESKAYWMGVMALDDEMAKAEAIGQPLTGNEILKKAMEIAPLHMMSISERIEAMKEQLKPKKSVVKEINKANKGRIVKTGVDRAGRKVVQYANGDIEYAD